VVTEIRRMIMKILICGKGGCGKSTVVALLAKELAGRENRVLVIDSDESNIGLHHRLGMTKPADFMNYFGGKKILFEKAKEITNKWKLKDLPKDYLSEKGNLCLLSMGKIYEFGEGCACPINALSSKLLEVLDLEDKEFMIADTDAGIEHFGRGVDKGVDLLIVIIDPSRDSILLAQKISILGKQLEKPTYYVLNRVNRETEKLLLDSVDKEKVIAVIHENKDVLMSCLAGNELTISLEGIREIADRSESEKRKKIIKSI
jgi:CO dehydrogenase maturation factor